MPRVQVARPEDAAEVAALGRLLHEESSYAPIPYNAEKVEALMERLARGDGVVFVVRDEDSIVGGLAGAVAAHWFSDETLGFDYSFFIRADVRNGFTASKLLFAFITWCRLRGAKRVRLGITTGINVERTAKLYRMCGFKDIGGNLFELEL